MGDVALCLEEIQMSVNDSAMNSNSVHLMLEPIKTLWGNLLNRMDKQALLRNLDYARKRAPNANLMELLELVKFYWERDNRI
jgi:phage anti-repressor protein